MALNLTKIADAIVEPVTLALAHAQCRIDAGFTADDVLLTLYISSARQTAEKIMRRAIFNQTWQRTLDSFPLSTSLDYTASPADRWNLPVYGAQVNRLAIDLPMGRALAVNSISYQACNGDVFTLPPATYAADLTGIPCRLTPAQISEGSSVWPFQGGYLPGSVKIVWLAGNCVAQISDSLAVVAAGDPATYSVTISQASSIYSGTALLTSAIALFDASGNPVPFTNANGVLTVPSSYTAGEQTLNITNGQMLTATYYLGNCPADIQHAILWLVAHYYRNGEAATDLNLKDLPHGVQSKLSPHIIEWSDYRPC